VALVGFSTGAIAPGDVPRALAALRGRGARAVELSALRAHEVEPLLAALPGLDLTGFDYVSVHAPSRFAAVDEARLADALAVFVPLGYPVVLHPDAVHDFAVWRRLGRGVAIENMDRRKPLGRTVLELGRVFDRLPDASFCFDVGHAHQIDRTMNDADVLLRELGARLAQVHVSEVTTRGRHDPLSRSAVAAFRKVARWIPAGVPILVEVPVSPADPAAIEGQMALAAEALVS
jgi:sugar phosphate isomerase/epimerase